MKKLLLCYLFSLTAIVCQAEEVIEINSLSDLQTLRNNVNNGTNTYAGKTVSLNCDLKLDAWTPIGLVDDASQTFQGTFDGKGHTVIIDVNTDGAVAGFFGYLRGTVEHLKVMGSVLCTNTTTSAAGGIAGYNHGGTISGCANLATIIGYICGGIVGETEGGEICDCYNTGYIGSNGSATYLAGIAGKNNGGNINHVFASCTVEAISGAYAGITTSGAPTNAYYNVKTHTGVTLGGSETLTGTALQTRLSNSGINTVWEYTEGLPWLVLMEAKPVYLMDKADNTAFLQTYLSQERRVQLLGRTLQKNGYWNTLCLPFAMTAEKIAASPLADATIKEFTSATVTDNKLSIGFTTVSAIEAGKPYLVKWPSGENITDPKFDNVTSSVTEPATVTCGDVKFIGTFSPIPLKDDGTQLFVGSNNQIHYPSKADYSINSCRAYFDVNWTITAGARMEIAIVDDGETTGIGSVTPALSKGEGNSGDEGSVYYTLDGRKLPGKPTAKGLYIVNGKKVVIK